MYRATLALGVVLLATGVVGANAGPPPRLIPVEHRITTEKEYPDYDFYIIREWENVEVVKPHSKITTVEYKVKAVKFDPKTPIELKAKSGEVGYDRLVVVLKGTEKNYSNKDDFHSALRSQRGGGIQGRVEAKAPFWPWDRVSVTDKRDKIVREHKVEKIDAKDGIVFSTKDVEPSKDGEKKGPEKKDSPDEDALGVSAFTPRGGTLIAGLAASLAMLLGGLWVVGRTRRKV